MPTTSMNIVLSRFLPQFSQFSRRQNSYKSSFDNFQPRISQKPPTLQKNYNRYFVRFKVFRYKIINNWRIVNTIWYATKSSVFGSRGSG